MQLVQRRGVSALLQWPECPRCPWWLGSSDPTIVDVAREANMSKRGTRIASLTARMAAAVAIAASAAMPIAPALAADPDPDMPTEAEYRSVSLLRVLEHVTNHIERNCGKDTAPASVTAAQAARAWKQRNAEYLGFAHHRADGYRELVRRAGASEEKLRAYDANDQNALQDFALRVMWPVLSKDTPPGQARTDGEVCAELQAIIEGREFDLARREPQLSTDLGRR